MKITSADGVKGTLITCTVSGKVFFRVYGEDHSFVDYKLTHNDLQVTIQDSDAAFYERDGRYILDHAPGTLGIKT